MLFDLRSERLGLLFLHAVGFGFCVWLYKINYVLGRKMEGLDGTDRQAAATGYGHSDQAASDRTGTDSANSTGATSADAYTGAGERARIILGEVEAYRAWGLAGDFLVSFNGAVWPPDVPMDGSGIDIDNATGIYAFAKLSVAKEYAQAYLRNGAACAIGRVLMWGEVVVHETGYRAEYARPVEIIAVFNTKTTATDIERRYRLEENPQ